MGCCGVCAAGVDCAMSWTEYEREKAKIERLNLSYGEYQKAIRKLLKRLKL